MRLALVISGTLLLLLVVAVTAQAKMYDEEFGQISQGSLQTLAEDEHDEPLDSADDREEELASSLKTNPGSLAETSLSWIKENSGGHWTEKDGDGGGFDYGGGNTMGRDGNAKGEDSSVDPEEEEGVSYTYHQCYQLGRGRQKTAREVPYCAPIDEKHEVRCCSHKTIPGYTKMSCGGKAVWTASNAKGFGGCQHALNHDDAEDICASMGARLCSKAELDADCSAGTGCGHDWDLIWSSTPCEGCVRKIAGTPEIPPVTKGGDSNCANGIQGPGAFCCPRSCGVCGDKFCQRRAGGARMCCTPAAPSSAAAAAALSCDRRPAPCLMNPARVNATNPRMPLLKQRRLLEQGLRRQAD